MRVVVPYTTVSPETVQALAGSGHAAEFVDVSGSDRDYWELLSALWGAGETFAVVEQDIVVADGSLASLERCSGAWCACTYPYLGSDGYAGLGCTKFDARLLMEHPDVMEEAGWYSDSHHTPGHWCTLDFALQSALAKRGMRVCLHGPVGHLSPTPSHGCC